MEAPVNIVGVSMVACGDNFSAAITGQHGGHRSVNLTDTGKVFTWGNNSVGQLGLGHDDPAPFPTLVTALSTKVTTFVACGQLHMGVISDAGKVYTWGLNSDGQLGHGNTSRRCLLPDIVHPARRNRMLMIALGAAHSLALTGCVCVFFC
jgi:hypothetical protein